MSIPEAQVAKASTVVVSDVGDKEGDATASDGSESHEALLDLTQYHEHNAGRLVVDPEYVTLSQMPYLNPP